MRAIEHCLPWEKTKQILDELLVALASFDCPRSMALLSDAVIEYPRRRNIRDYVWTSKTPAASAMTIAKSPNLHPSAGCRMAAREPRRAILALL